MRREQAAGIAALVALVACGRDGPSVPTRDAGRVMDASAARAWRGFPEPFTGELVITSPEGDALGARPLLVGGDRFRVDDPARDVSVVIDARAGRMAVADRRTHRLDDAPVPPSYAPMVALARTGVPCTAGEGDTCRMLGTEMLDGVLVERWTGARADGFTWLWLDRALGFPVRVEDAGGTTFVVHVRERAAPPEAAFDAAALAREEALPPPRSPCDPRERTLRRVIVPEGEGERELRLQPADAAGQVAGGAADRNRFAAMWRRDLNGDRRPDLLVREPLTCTPAGTCACELHVDCGDGTVERVFSAMASEVRIVPRAHGFADLVVTTREREDRGVEVTETRWRFEGREYHAAAEHGR